MSRKTVIFGNGLGMALSPQKFSLQYALDQVWNDTDVLDETQKELIRACLPKGQNQPCAENDLDTLQSALSACDFLAGIHCESTHWLNQHGHDFRVAVRQLIYQTAKQFHLMGCLLPDAFLNPFCDFVSRTKSHVCTLNYDNLLYGPMTDRRRGVFDGYNVLVDGFLKGNFNEENLERKHTNNFGYYLHLHGSPLFYEDAGTVKKCSQGCFLETVKHSPIVLTHVKHKPMVIADSLFLLCYWLCLRKAIRESDEVILFGYSGLDEHLNDEVRLSKRIQIVEWNGSGEQMAREEFWRKKLGHDENDLKLLQLANILDFTDWSE